MCGAIGIRSLLLTDWTEVLREKFAKRVLLLIEWTLALWHAPLLWPRRSLLAHWTALARSLRILEDSVFGVDSPRDSCLPERNLWPWTTKWWGRVAVIIDYRV